MEKIDVDAENAKWDKIIRQWRSERLNEWQDIETAPKDGTRVLLYATIHSRLEPKMTIVAGKYSRGWWSQGSTLSYVTHWMPLPEKPSSNP